MTQEDLEFKSGVTRQAISRAEKHPEKSQVSTIRDIAAALGVTTEQLYSPPPQARPLPVDREEFLREFESDFQAFYADGSLSMEDVLDRMIRVKEQLKKRNP